MLQKGGSHCLGEKVTCVSDMHDSWCKTLEYRKERQKIKLEISSIVLLSVI